MYSFSLREYMRSESEKSFNECQMKRARFKSLGLAYLSPQNKSLAQSFRYMRNKPTIIAFKTPSLENCEQRDSSNSLGMFHFFHLITFLTFCNWLDRHKKVLCIYHNIYIYDNFLSKCFLCQGRQISSLSFTFSPERQAEEGRIGIQEGEASPKASPIKAVNYPVGKPLEVG